MTGAQLPGGQQLPGQTGTTARFSMMTFTSQDTICVSSYTHTHEESERIAETMFSWVAARWSYSPTADVESLPQQCSMRQRLPSMREHENGHALSK
jgi:hypothetical protein